MTKTTENKRVSRTGGLLWVAVMVGALCITSLSVRVSSEAVDPPACQPEIDRKFLTQVEGRLHRGGHVQSFDGWMMERYTSGSVKSRSRVSHGVLHGVSEGWNTEGQLEVREHFVLGVSHGLRTKWHPNGRLLSEATIMEGRIDGVFRRWHENGVLAEEIPMHEGQPDGVSRAWYPSGCQKAEVRLSEGRVQDKQYWEDGAMPPARHLTASTN